ncbi:AraC family transcriptional regulator [Microbispora sp. RL4-1S]|uniref:AraC family transcriptional regulator n=1 Tax=Microbispora oryzae TaxID=2806554 RepID=A0A940WSB1_9ACTN|nr:AraC family transcriptional regulator [Microbispora oryzae]MBP2706131.1 AraC family transcriptional regulator [Microbispora oryzae]
MDLLDRLRRLIVRHAGGGPHAVKTIMEGVTVGRVDQPTPPEAAMLKPSVAIVALGMKRLILNGVPYDYRAGQYLVASLDLPAVGQALRASPEEPFVVVSIRLRPADIAPLLLEATALKPPAFTGLAISDATPELLDPVVRLLETVDRPDDMRVLAPGYRREVLWRLITGEQGALVRQIGLTGGNLTHVSRAIQWIRDHYREPIRVGQLAALAGMSESSFHRYFRSATSMTPIQFQKQIRLQAARTLLMTQSESVAEIGYFVGYESPSQFSREYRKTFGTSPGRETGRPSARPQAVP